MFRSIIGKLFMKKIVVFSALFLALSTSFYSANAQVNINVSIQPQWGPDGYSYVEYYFFPDIGIYYHVPKHKYVHRNPAGKWVFSNGLPHAHRSYNLYTGYKVVLNQPNAYNYYNDHKVKYAHFKGNRSQVVLKNNKGPKIKVKPGKVSSNGNGNGKGKRKNH